MTELMKQKQTMETDSHSHFEKRREQLETEKKELQFQLDEKRKELQRVLGNLQYWKCNKFGFIIILLLLSVKCDMINERNVTIETELNKQQKISGNLFV